MAETPSRLPLRLLGAIALSAMLAPLNSTMVAVALPEISRTLNADSATLRQALVTSYLLTNVVLQSPGGKLGDRLGYRRALGLGQALLGFGAAIAYFWPTLYVLTASRIIMAAGGAIMLPSATAMLRTELPAESRGRAFGTFGAIVGVAAGLGPTLGAQLVARFGWTSIFLVNLPVLVLSVALGHLGVSKGQSSRPPVQSRFDIAGSALLGLSLLGVVVGLQNTRYLWVAGLGLLGFGPFVWWERRVSDPVIDFSLFRRRAFVAGCLLTACQNFAMYALIFELPQVAGRLFAVGPKDVGRTLLAMMGTMVLASPIAGRLADRFGGRTIAIIGTTVALGGMLLLTVRPFTGLSEATPALVVLGAGMGLTMSPAQTISISDVPKERSGMAAGISSTLRYVGGIGGVTMLSVVLTDEPSRDVVLQQHRASLLLFCISLALGIIAAFRLTLTPGPSNDSPENPAASGQAG